MNPLVAHGGASHQSQPTDVGSKIALPEKMNILEAFSQQKMLIGTAPVLFLLASRELRSVN